VYRFTDRILIEKPKNCVLQLNQEVLNTYLDFLTLCSLNTLFSDDGQHLMQHEHEIFYLSSEQIHLEKGRIIVLFENVEAEVSQLNADENGIYIFGETIKPAHFGFGHKVWCMQCIGCVVRYCKGRCTCVTWE